MSMPLLQVCGLSVVAPNGRRLLSNVSLALDEREVLGIIGASGAGKTVLSQALVNWLPSGLRVIEGDVLWRGESLLGMTERRLRGVRGREIAYVGANPMGALDPTLPVGHQIVEKLRCVMPTLPTAEARKRVIDLLAAVRIPSAAARFHDYPSQFSGGMMQRVLLVDALVGNPALLVADNVTQPLDVTIAAQILRLLRDLGDRFATAVAFISSSLPVVSTIAGQMLVLSDGCIVERAPTATLISAPKHAYTRTLISEVPRIWQPGSGPGRTRPAPKPADVPVISLRDVTRSYRVRRRGSLAAHSMVRAVRNVTFDVYTGENFGVVGESGCGKSTLMRLLTRLEVPDDGQVLIDGHDLDTLSRREMLAMRRKVQLVLQDPVNALPPRTSIGAMLAEPLRIHGWKDSSVIRARVLEVMAETGLSQSLYEELPLGLSTGQRQRVNVARAMVLRPRVLIMDETLSMLDQTEQSRLLDLFEQLQTQYGLTYVYISHDLAMVRRVCDRVAVMYLGEVVEVADNERLFFDPGHPYTRALLSAVPALEERRYRPEDCLLEGEPPSPIDLPPGCSFAGRCPHAFDRCQHESPALVARGDRNFAACFLVNPPARHEQAA